MSKIADINEPADELEHLIADLSKSGKLIFVFGDGLTTAHLAGTTTPEFGGPADRYRLAFVQGRSDYAEREGGR